MESNNKEGVFNDRGDMGKTQDPRRSQFMVRRKSNGLRAETSKNYMDFDTDSESEKDTKRCFSCESIKTQKSNSNISKKENSDYIRRLKPVLAMEDVSVLNEDKIYKPRKKSITSDIIENEKDLASDSETAEKTKDLKVEVIRIIEKDFNRRTDILYADLESVYLCANIYVFGALLYFRVTRKPQSVIGAIFIILFVIFLINFFPN